MELNKHMEAQTHCSPNANPKQESLFTTISVSYLPAVVFLSLQLENLHIFPPWWRRRSYLLPRWALALLLQALQRWRLSCRGWGESWRASPACSGCLAGDDEHKSLFYQPCSGLLPPSQASARRRRVPVLSWAWALKIFLPWACLLPGCSHVCSATSLCLVSPDFMCIQSSAAPKGTLLLFLLLLTAQYYFVHLIQYKAITECKGLRKYREICLE